MGMWGYFDDQSDAVQELWFTFEETYPILPDESNVRQFWNYVYHYMLEEEKKFDGSSMWHKWVGFLLASLYFIKSKRSATWRGVTTQIQAPIRTSLDLHMAKTFPYQLRTKAIYSLEMMLKHFVSSDWVDPKQRKKALLQELALFRKN